MGISPNIQPNPAAKDNNVLSGVAATSATNAWAVGAYPKGGISHPGPPLLLTGDLEHPAIGQAGLAAPRLLLAAFSSVNSLSEAASLLGPCQGLPGTAAR